MLLHFYQLLKNINVNHILLAILIIIDEAVKATDRFAFLEGKFNTLRNTDN